jgi:hypothetical protein
VVAFQRVAKLFGDMSFGIGRPKFAPEIGVRFTTTDYHPIWGNNDLHREGVEVVLAQKIIKDGATSLLFGFRQAARFRDAFVLTIMLEF